MHDDLSHLYHVALFITKGSQFNELYFNPLLDLIRLHYILYSVLY